VIGTRAARFAEVPNGTRLRIDGVARELDPMLTSPVAGCACVAFRLVIEEPGWHPVLERARSVRFLVVDGGVGVRVEGPFRVLLQTAYEWDFGNDVQRRIAQVIGADRLAGEGMLGAIQAGDPIERAIAPTGRTAADEIYCQNYRYFEALIRPGDRVVVEGFAAVMVDPAGTRAGLREPPLLHTLTGTAERPVVVTLPDPGSVGP
jgi:hypothetical protein